MMAGNMTEGLRNWVYDLLDMLILCKEFCKFELRLSREEIWEEVEALL